MDRLALLPELRLDLLVHAGEGGRFVVLFRATWDRIPEAARAAITAHWRGRENWPLEAGSPLAALIPSAAPPLLGAGGGVSPDGGALAFAADALAHMDDGETADTIAHAIARVAQLASSTSPADAALAGYFDEAQRDYWASQIAESWGFNVSLLPWR